MKVFPFRSLALWTCATACFAAVDAPTPAPPVAEIVGRMMEVDRLTTPHLLGYTSRRTYDLENKRFSKRANMTVRADYTYPGHKAFRILSENGSAVIRNRVLRRMLETERTASPEATRISPDNYSFTFEKTEALDQRPSFVLAVMPRTANPLLFRGRIWVDAEDYAIARIEGSPSKNPSFLIRKTTFVHRYAKHGPFWLPVSNVSETDTLFFGHTGIRVEYKDYQLDIDGSVASSGGRQ